MKDRLPITVIGDREGSTVYLDLCFVQVMLDERRHEELLRLINEFIKEANDFIFAYQFKEAK